MNATEIMQDLVNNRGAVLEIYGEKSGDRSQETEDESLILLGAAELLDPTHLFYVAIPAVGSVPPCLRGLSLRFSSLKRLHALAVGFYDEHGDLIARLAQIRECELDGLVEQQHAAQFAAWKKTMLDPKTGPALRTAITAARADAARGILSPVS